MLRTAILLLLLLFSSQPLKAQDSYLIEKVAPGVFAAIINPAGSAASNAVIVDLGNQLIICGAHFSPKATNDLIAAASELSPNPIRAFVLTHHHPGSGFVDFSFPPEKDLVVSIETRLILKQEKRQLPNQLVFFKEGLTFEGTERTLVLTNVGPAHSQGDMLVYVPQDKVLFASDLLYFDHAGYLAGGPLPNWGLTLEGIKALKAKILIPGNGRIGTIEDLHSFTAYLKDFYNRVLEHVDKGDSLETTLAKFALPKHQNLPGYGEYMPGNIERTYLQLKKD